MSLLSNVKQSEPQEDPPTEPVVPCLGCKKDFVWWIHPVQLCDDCVQKEYDKEDV